MLFVIMPSAEIVKIFTLMAILATVVAIKEMIASLIIARQLQIHVKINL